MQHQPREDKFGAYFRNTQAFDALALVGNSGKVTKIT